MTYIFGGKYDDGVVLVGDRRIMRGGEHVNEDKLIKLNDNLVVGASGATGLFDKFVNKLLELNIGEIKKPKDYFKILSIIEAIVPQINRRYEDAVGEDGYIELLIAIKNPQTKKAELWHINPSGLPENVKSNYVIGSGATYGKIFHKYAMAASKKIDEDNTEIGLLLIGLFPIKCIQKFELTTTVGGTPQLCVMKNNEPAFIDKDLHDKDKIKKFEELLEKLNQEINELLKIMFADII